MNVSLETWPLDTEIKECVGTTSTVAASVDDQPTLKQKNHTHTQQQQQQQQNSTRALGNEHARRKHSRSRENTTPHTNTPLCLSVDCLRGPVLARTRHWRLGDCVAVRGSGTHAIRRLSMEAQTSAVSERERTASALLHSKAGNRVEPDDSPTDDGSTQSSPPLPFAPVHPTPS